MKTRVKFSGEKADIQQAGLSPRMWKKFTKRLEGHFPRGGEIFLRLERSSPGNLRFMMEEFGVKRYIRVWCGKSSKEYDRLLPGLVISCQKFLMSQGAMGGYEVQDSIRSMGEWVIFEVILFFEGDLLFKFLQDGMSQTEDHPQSFRIIAKNLAQKVNTIHKVEFRKWSFDKPTPPIRRGEYPRALKDIADRLEFYVPKEEDHPLITGDQRRILKQWAEDMRYDWQKKSNRLCLVHGDLSRWNIIIQDADVHIFDHSPRIFLGEPRWDDGRLVADLLRLYIGSGKNKLIRVFTDTFIEESEKLSEDKLYWEGLCWGIFAMLLIKLYPKGRPIKDRQVAEEYLWESLRILEQGRFSWE